MLKRNLFLTFFAVFIAVLPSCEDIDVKREILVITVDIRDYGSTWVEGRGEIVDLGEGPVLDHGFLVSRNAQNPNIITDRKISLGQVFTPGEVTGTVSNLAPGTLYYLFAYVVNEDQGVVYGEPISFTTEWTSGYNEEWIYYDSGNNDGGVGLTNGGSFHVAIRFYPADLEEYAGGQLTHVRLWVRSLDCSYAIKIWLGTTLILNQPLTPAEITLNDWSEIVLQQAVNITGNQTLVIGYAVYSHPAGIYPAGHDEGPAISGRGDLYSNDEGVTWQSLSIIEPDLNYNWNLRGYVVYPSGKSSVLATGSQRTESEASAVPFFSNIEALGLASSTQNKN